MDKDEETPISRALKRREELQDAIRTYAKELEKIEQFLATYRELQGQPANFRAQLGKVSVKVSRQERQEDTGITISQEAFEQFVRALLLEVGRPMESPEIIDKLQERGLRIGGANITKQTWNKLWMAKKAGELIHMPQLGYWLPEHELRDEAKAEAAEARKARIKKQNLKPRSKVAKGRPWKGNPIGRRRKVSLEQLAVAEGWVLEGRMTRAEIAQELGGVSVGLVAKYFTGGADAILKRRAIPPNLLNKQDAEREHARLRHDIAKFEDQRAPECENLKERLGAIERNNPSLRDG